VRAEWQRRVLQSGGTGNALKVQGNRPQQNNNQRANFPRNNNAYCKYHHMKGHSTESCMARKSAEANKAKNKPQAKVAQTNQAEETCHECYVDQQRTRVSDP
jgi:hypothetical protein